MQLSHPESEIVQQALEDAGVGSAFDGASWPIFSAIEPDLPDECITVFDTQGLEDGREHVGGETLDHPGIQIRVRSKHSNTGRVKANAIRKTLATDMFQVGVTLDATQYVIACFSRIGQVLSLGPESSSKRYIFTINAVIAVREAA